MKFENCLSFHLLLDFSKNLMINIEDCIVVIMMMMMIRVLKKLFLDYWNVHKSLWIDNVNFLRGVKVTCWDKIKFFFGKIPFDIVYVYIYSWFQHFTIQLNVLRLWYKSSISKIHIIMLKIEQSELNKGYVYYVFISCHCLYFQFS